MVVMDEWLMTMVQEPGIFVVQREERSRVEVQCKIWLGWKISGG